MQFNALMAADRLLIPLQADAYNLQSLQQITEAAQEIAGSNELLKIAGIIITQYDQRPIINRQLRAKLTEAAAEQGIPFLGAVRKGVVVQEAAALQLSLFEYAPRSKPAKDYLQIYNRIMKLEG